MATIKKPIKKAQNGAKTKDSTDIFKSRAKDMARKSLYAEAKGDKKLSNVYMDAASKASSAASRQSKKGKPGYDKNGYPIKKNGGPIKKAQTGKRVPVKSVSTLTPAGTTVDMKPTAPMPKLREYSNQELKKNAEQQIKIQRANRLSEVYHKSYDDYTKNPKHWLKPGLSYDGFMEALKTNAEKNAAKNRRWDWLKSDGGGSSGDGGGAKSPCKGGFCPGLNSGSRNGSKIKKAKSGATISKAKDGKWMQKAAASIKKRGTAGKCTPITKPGCTGKAKALAKTFKKIAKSNKKK